MTNNLEPQFKIIHNGNKFKDMLDHQSFNPDQADNFNMMRHKSAY